MAAWQTCHICGGIGKDEMGEEDCPKCNGTGRIPIDKD
jgi:DnaJ-class molecular chaperone